MNFVTWIRWLLVPAILLPMIIAVLFGLIGLLTAIEDATGAAVVRAVGWIVLVLWIVNVAALTIAVAADIVIREQRVERGKRDDTLV